MDGQRFDGVIRTLTKSRRSLLSGMLAVTGGWLGAPDAETKKRRKKQPQPVFNEFGCLNVGDPCKRGEQCCSGICTGKKGRRRCKAHDRGTCAAGAQPEFCGGTNVACTTSFGQPGICATTTGNAGYCLVDAACYACKTDADCRTAYGGLFAQTIACTRCAECASTGGTACAIPDTPQTM